MATRSIFQCVVAAVGGVTIGLLLAAGPASREAGDPAATSPAPSLPTSPAAASRATVLWISLDGVRGDYIDKTDTPFFHRMIREGAWTRRMTPITPSLTFPSHTSEATGTPADRHGIVGNAFYDETTKKRYNFPADATLLGAEPIWVTAERNGLRAAVTDWPLSQNEAGPAVASHFETAFDKNLSDEQRAEHFMNQWADDADAKPLRLIMGYLEATDPAGHRYGPAAPEVLAKLRDTDALLAKVATRAVAIFKRHAAPNDQLYILITTDHGMAAIEHQVNFEKLFSAKLPHAVTFVTSGPVAYVALDQVPDGERHAIETGMLEQLRSYDFLSAYRRDELPPQWHLDYPSRVGSIIVMLHKGYAFGARLPLPVYDINRLGDTALKGMHGYPPADDPDMLGFAAIWRYPTPIGGVDLGTVDALRFNPTVARLLDIPPAPGVEAKPLSLEQ